MAKTQLETCCRNILSDKITENKKGFKQVDDLLKLPEILELLDRRTDSKSKELNWSLLLGWVHGSVLRAAKRLKPNDHHSKAREFSVVYKRVLKVADMRGERLRAVDIVSVHIIDVLVDEAYCRFLGSDYLSLLKYVLCSRQHVVAVTTSKWLNLLKVIINAWSKGSEHIPAWMVVNCVNNIVKKTSVLTVLPNEELLSFFITFIDKEWSKNVDRNQVFVSATIELGFVYSKALWELKWEPSDIFKIGAVLIPRIVRCKRAVMMKMTTLDFISLQVNMSNIMKGADLSEEILECREWVYKDLMLSNSLQSLSTPALYLDMAARVISSCQKPLDSAPVNKRRKTTNIFTLLEGIGTMPTQQKSLVLGVTKYLVAGIYFTDADLTNILSNLVTLLNNSKSPQGLAGQVFDLIGQVVNTYPTKVFKLQEKQIYSLCLRYLNSCEVQCVQILLRLYDLNSDLDAADVMEKLKFPKESNIGLILHHITKQPLDDKMLTWIISPGLSSGEGYSHRVASDVGEALAGWCLKGYKRLVHTPPSPDCGSYSVLLFDEELPSTEELEKTARTFDVDKTMLERAAVHLSEGLRNLPNQATEQRLYYYTVISSMLGALNEFSSESQDLQPLLMELGNIEVSVELYPAVLSFAKCSVSPIPTSWLTHFNSLLRDPGSQPNSQEGMMGEDENMAPSSTFLSATMAFPSSSSYPSSTAFPTSTAAAQLSAENEDDDKVDFVCQSKLQVIDILHSWCVTHPPSSLDILNLLSTFITDPDSLPLKQWTACTLQSLKLFCKVRGLSARNGEMLAESARALLEQHHRDTALSGEVLECMSWLLRTCHSLSTAPETISQYILQPFLNLLASNKLGLPCKVPLIKCLRALLLTSKCTDKIDAVELLCKLSTDSVPAVRLAMLVKIPLMMGDMPSVHLEVLDTVWSKYTSCAEVEQLKNTVCDIGSLQRSLILCLTSFLSKSVVCQVPGLHKLCLISAPSNYHVIQKALAQVSSKLGYRDSAQLLTRYCEPLMAGWINEGRSVQDFPYIVFGYTAQKDFYQAQVEGIAIKLLLEGHYAQLEDIATTMELQLKEVLKGRVLGSLCAAIIPGSMSTLQSGQGKAVKAFEYLREQLTGAVVTAFLKRNVGMVVPMMAMRLHEPVTENTLYSAHTAPDTVLLYQPSYSSKWIISAVEFMIKSRKDPTKRPGLTKLLALSNEGVPGVLLLLYSELCKQHCASHRRSLLTAYQMVVTQLVMDPHNDLTTDTLWTCYTQDILCSLTNIINTFKEEGVAGQCVEVLSTLLTATPFCYPIIEPVIGPLVHTLASVQDNVKVDVLLRHVLQGWVSPVCLPLVEFCEPALSKFYSQHTSKPLLPQELEWGVRTMCGAYWYLTHSTQHDPNLLNTAIYTLLKSGCPRVSTLLGSLGMLEVDFSKVDMLAPTDKCIDWDKVFAPLTVFNEHEYVVKIVDLVTPLLRDPCPEVKRCAITTLSTLMRSSPGQTLINLARTNGVLDVLNAVIPFTQTTNFIIAISSQRQCQLTEIMDISMFQCCESDALRCLIPLVTSQDSLFKAFLPYVFHDLLSQKERDYKAQLSALIKVALDTPQIFHLKIIEYLRSKEVASKRGTPFDNNFWLDVDYLAASRAATSLSLHTASLLYLHIHCEGRDKQAQLSMLKDNLSQEQLLEVYLHLGDTDAIQGVEYTSRASRLKILAHQHRWSELLTHAGLAQDSDALLASVKITTPFVLPKLLGASSTKPTEHHYEAAWRSSKWDLSPSSDSLHSSIYTALLTAWNNPDHLDKELEAARTRCLTLQPKHQFVFTRLLQEVKEISHTFSGEKGEVPSWLSTPSSPTSQQFRDWEPVYQCRAVLSNLLNLPKQLKQEVLLDCARAARYSKEYQAAHRFLALGINLGPNYLLSIEEAQVEWSSGERQYGLSKLNTLITHLADKPPPVWGKLLLTQAHWLTETKKEFPSYVMDNCLMTAVEWCKDEQSEDLGRAHLECALFADEQYKHADQFIESSAYQDKRDCVKKTLEDIEVLKKQGSQTNRKQISSLSMQVNEDRETLARWKEERTTYLKLSIQHYLQCLTLTHDSDLHVFRLCSLLLDNSDLEEVTEMVSESLPQLPAHKLIPPMYQLAARLGRGDKLEPILQKVILTAASEHPYHVLPVLLALKNAQLDCRFLTSETKGPDQPRTKVACSILDLLSKNSDLQGIVADIDTLFEAYVEWANHDVKQLRDKCAATRKAMTIPSKLKITRLSNLSCLPLLTTDIPVQQSGGYGNFVHLVKFQSEFSTPGGINLPKLTFALCSDGVIRKQLVKGKDDLRQDSVMEQVFGVANNLLRENRLTKEIQVRTYKVLALSQRSGLVEWCEDTMPIGAYLIGTGSGGAHAKYRPKDLTSKAVRTKMMETRSKSPGTLYKTYREQCELFKPVFRHYFLENFSNPCQWYQQRTNYTHSLAATSIIGHIVGLGDRHVQNILIDHNTSELIHIDLGVAFDQGNQLSIPERVPFRLTRDLVDGLGVTGTEGSFRGCCQHVMKVLQDNKELLTAVIEVFIHDPLYYMCVKDGKRSSNTQPLNNKQAHRVLASLGAKLDGIEEGVVLGVEGQINHLIRHAMDPKNLCKIFAGWQAWV